HRDRQHRRADAAQCRVHRAQVFDHGVAVVAAADDVVRAGEDRCEVGTHREGGPELLLADLARLATADREIRVEQRFALRLRDVQGQAVCPSAMPAIGARILETFRRGVAERDVARESQGRRESESSSRARLAAESLAAIAPRTPCAPGSADAPMVLSMARCSAALRRVADASWPPQAAARSTKLAKIVYRTGSLRVGTTAKLVECTVLRRDHCEPSSLRAPVPCATSFIVKLSSSSSALTRYCTQPPGTLLLSHHSCRAPALPKRTCRALKLAARVGTVAVAA